MGRDKGPGLPTRCYALERDVQRTVVEFLQLDGWRPIRTDPVSDRKRGKGFGEIGMPDYLFVRYRPMQVANPEARLAHRDDIVECIWVEFKARGQKPRPDQASWHERERTHGAVVYVVGDIDLFIAWYKQSHLYRRRHLEAGHRFTKVADQRGVDADGSGAEHRHQAADARLG